MQWFELARQLNSVVEAVELANAFLRQDGQRVELNLDIDPLPQLLQTKESTSNRKPHVGNRVADAWYLGARVGLCHVQRGFSDWDKESFSCALSCVVNYLSLFPARRLSESHKPVAQRRQALSWVQPYRNKLMVATSVKYASPQAHRDALVEQQLAVLLHLEQDESSYTPKRTNWSASKKASRRVRKPRANEIAVVPGEIPTSSDRSEAEYLLRFELLRNPLAFKAFPILEALHALVATLREEFPWAQDAIALVASDLFARKRHGAVRLGLAPV